MHFICQSPQCGVHIPRVCSIGAAIGCLCLRYARQVGDYPSANFALGNTDCELLVWTLFCAGNNLVHGQEVKFLLEVVWYFELPPARIQRFHLFRYSVQVEWAI